MAPKCYLKRRIKGSWRILLGTDRPTQGYADSFPCPEFVIPKVFTARPYAKRGICRHRVSVCPSVCLCVCLRMSVTLQYCITSISANANGSRDAASRRTDHIALLIELNYQAASVGQ